MRIGCVFLLHIRLRGCMLSDMKLTADTITDEQIRELWARRDGLTGDEVLHVIRAHDGLDLNNPDNRHPGFVEAFIKPARARCAEILNARAEGKS